MLDRLGLWDRYAANLRRRDLSPRTINLSRFVLSKLPRDLADVTEDDIVFLVGAPGLKAGTRKCYQSRLSAFYGWVCDERRRLLEHNPCIALEPVRYNEGIPNPIDAGQLARAIAEADPRMRLWLMLMAYQGLRCVEVAGLRSEGIRGNTLVVLGKGRKERGLPLHPLVRVELEAWGGTGYLFPGRTHPHLTAQHVSELVNAYLRGKGIPWTAHKIRHRYATDILDGSGDLMGLKDLLGHASVATTQNYTKVNPQRLAAAVAALDYGLPDAS